MKKIILIVLIFVTLLNFIFLVIALTNKSSSLYDYRLIIGISSMIFGGFLKQEILDLRKKN